jgi:hypothetical protein
MEERKKNLLINYNKSLKIFLLINKILSFFYKK